MAEVTQNPFLINKNLRYLLILLSFFLMLAYDIISKYNSWKAKFKSLEKWGSRITINLFFSKIEFPIPRKMSRPLICM